MARYLGFAAVVAFASPARADDVLHPGTPTLDPPTLVALGISLPITGDDNFNATVWVRYRVAGTTEWTQSLPLLHVHAEAVVGLTVPTQFAGSIFDLRPDTAYEIELHAVDPDGSIDMTQTLTGKTRAVPADPAQPRIVEVSGGPELTAALGAAQPGDIIELAAGTYAGNFAIQASGTETAPIVIRGVTQAATLDGGACTGCNVLEVYGSYVHLENLTIQSATRALRFQTAGAHDNVVRRVHIRDVTLAIGSQPDQANFYIADNTLEGRLVWPCVYTSDDPACNGSPAQHGLHANDDGIHVEGDGHVIAHNRISGFGDAMKTEQDGARSVDFYGNDVLWTYDNGIELDGSQRNTRAFRNRFTNTFATLSFQPIFGGPAYAFRNVLVNVADEQFKLHARGTTPTVGAMIFHNTIIRAQRAVQCSTTAEPMYFTIENNLFVGPTAIADAHTVRWDVPSVATGTIDYNGYFPDGQFEYGYSGAGMTYPSFAAAAASGTFDGHSALVDPSTFADGAVGPDDWTQTLPPQTPVLAPGSPAIDRGVPLLGDGITGVAPDLGALEAGCDPPTWGVRPMGVDESNEPIGCTMGVGGDLSSDDFGTTGGRSGGCCDSGEDAAPTALLGVALFAISSARRRRA
jgi:hypothetical protein